MMEKEIETKKRGEMKIVIEQSGYIVFNKVKLACKNSCYVKLMFQLFI